VTDFVEADGNKRLGWPQINLDHVATLRSIPGGKFECLTAKGENLGVIHDYQLRDTPLAIVPETRHTMLYSFSLDRGELYTSRLPILAWAIDGVECAKPVCCAEYGYDSSNVVWCYEINDPTPFWIFPDGDSCPTLEEAAAHARAVLERKLAAEHKWMAKGAE